MKTIECKQVSLWDGGDRHNFGFFIDCNVSDEAIEKVNKHCSIVLKTLIVFDSLEEVADNTTANLRKKAWAKLTPLERDAVGFRGEPK